MKYQDKSFSVPQGHGDEWRRRHEETFGRGPNPHRECMRIQGVQDELGQPILVLDDDAFCLVCHHGVGCARPRVFDGECRECGAKIKPWTSLGDI